MIGEKQLESAACRFVLSLCRNYAKYYIIKLRVLKYLTYDDADYDDD